MDNVLSLQMLDTCAAFAICVSNVSCDSRQSCISSVSGVIIVDPKPAPGPIILA